MKKNRIIALITSIMCVALLVPSCNKLHKKETTRRTKATTEEDEGKTEPAETESSAVMNVLSLDQFVSDGLFYTEDVALPTPTPIPLVQTTLGLTNEDDGYFSGPLQDAVIVDNEYFRYTIFSAEATSDSYILNGEFENKTDIPYILYLFNPIIDNSCNDYYFYTETIAPHSIMADVTNFKGCIPNYDGTEPDRIAFVLVALAVDESGVADSSIFAPLNGSENQVNYVTCNLYPHGEENFVYEEQEIESGSTIVFDSEESRCDLEYFEVTDKYFIVHYSVLNKTSDYIRIQLDDENISLNGMGFTNSSGATGNCRTNNYIAPFARQTCAVAVKLSDIKKLGLDPMKIENVYFSLTCYSLTRNTGAMWATTVMQEVVFG